MRILSAWTGTSTHRVDQTVHSGTDVIMWQIRRQLKLLWVTQFFEKPFNAVFFIKSTQNTTPLNTGKLFLAISHIIIVLGAKCVFIKDWWDNCTGKWEVIFFYQIIILHRSPDLPLNENTMVFILFTVAKNLVPEEMGCRAVKLLRNLVVPALCRK